MEPRWWGLWKTGLLDPPPWAFYLRCHGVLSTFPPSSLHLFSFFFFLAVLHSLVLEKEMATHSGVLAWRIPGTGEPGGLWGRTELGTTEAT